MALGEGRRGLNPAGMRGNADARGTPGNRGGGGSASGAARRGHGRGGASTHAVKLPEEVEAASAGFTFERERRAQCESHVHYSVAEGGAESEYFLSTIGDLNLNECRHSLVQAFAAAGIATSRILEFTYGQLKLQTKDIPDEVTHELQAGTPNTYRSTLHDDKYWIMNPRGEIFKPAHANTRHYSWSMVITNNLQYDLNVDGDLSSRQLVYALRYSQYKAATKGANNQFGGKIVIKIEYGEMLSGAFTKWGYELIDNAMVLARLVDSKKWPTERSETPMTVEDEEVVVSAKYTFKIIDGKTCFEAGSNLWYQIGNFAVERVTDIYCWGNRENECPYWRLKIYAVIDPEVDQSIYVTPEMPCAIQTTDVGRIDAEILLPLAAVDDKTLPLYFQKVHPFISLERYCKVEHIVALINSMQASWPIPQQMANFFGRQAPPNENVFMMGNCCVVEGEIKTHASTGIIAIPSYFCGPLSIIPLSVQDFPKVIIIPQGWVRYHMLHCLYNYIMPARFLNNTVQAKAALALGVAHFYCSKFWKDSGLPISMVPVGWLVSTAQGTGKTEILELINSLTGWRDKGVMAGATCSFAGTGNHLSMRSDMSLCVDEMVTYTRDRTDESAKVKNLVHMVADGTSREVCGKSERPKTSFIGTSNVYVNERDGPYTSRVITIPFEALEGGADSHSADWDACKSLMSALMPDLSNLLWNGALDYEAITDCMSFMNKVAEVDRNRNASLWGIVLYFMILMDVLAGVVDSEHTFDFVCKSVTHAAYMSSQHGDVLNQFIIALEKVRTSTSPLNDATKCVHWHSTRGTDATRTTGTRLAPRASCTRTPPSRPRSRTNGTSSTACQIIARCKCQCTAARRSGSASASS